MKIENIKGSSKISSRPKSPFGSWLNYWEFHYNNCLSLKYKEIFTCPSCNQITKREDMCGCHVIKKDNSNDNNWYIVPMCNKCNQKEGIFEIDNNTTFIPVPSNNKECNS